MARSLEGENIVSRPASPPQEPEVAEVEGIETHGTASMRNVTGAKMDCGAAGLEAYVHSAEDCALIKGLDSHLK
jgi:hypothetical protein